MPPPIISVHSATGSDTQASGAGPSTALFGTANASTNGTGLVVTCGGSPDLSGVAVDGSAVIYINDSTAGARNFSAITAVDNTAKTVTVANAFGLSITTKDWAIGGIRASIGSTSSRKLFENNGTNGDAMAGWTIEMKSGHTETIASVITARRAGSAYVNGYITLRGEAGAATMPIVTSSQNGVSIELTAVFWQLRDFELRNTAVTKTASYAIQIVNSDMKIIGMRINHATNRHWRGINFAAFGGRTIVEACDISNCVSHAIFLTSNNYGATILNCFIKSNGGSGIITNGVSGPIIVKSCLFVSNTASGISLSHTGPVSSAAFLASDISQNTFHGNVNAISFDTTQATASNGYLNNLTILNNMFSSNSRGIFVNQTAPAWTAAMIDALVTIRGNNYSANSIQKYNVTITAYDEGTTAPAYVNTGTNNFTPTAVALYGLGYPRNNIGGSQSGSATPSIYTPGATHISSGGGGTTYVLPNKLNGIG